MRQCKLIGFWLLLIPFFSGSALSVEARNGCTIREVRENERGESFIEVMTSDRTVLWRKLNEGLKTTNGKKRDANGNLQDSAAAKLCKEQGMRLPEKADFEALMSCFELDQKDSHFLTFKGLSDLLAVFPDMDHHLYWTSTVLPNNEYFAFFFRSDHGYIDYCYQEHDLTVRCVK